MINEWLRDVAPVLGVLATFLAGLFAYRQAERQRIRDATSGTTVANAVGQAYRKELEPNLAEALEDLTKAVSLNTAVLTKVAGMLDKDAERTEREAQMRLLIDALKEQNLVIDKPSRTTR